MNPLLEVKDVCLSYHSLSGETAALSHISFHLMPEEFLLSWVLLVVESPLC